MYTIHAITAGDDEDSPRQTPPSQHNLELGRTSSSKEGRARLPTTITRQSPELGRKSPLKEKKTWATWISRNKKCFAIGTMCTLAGGLATQGYNSLSGVTARQQLTAMQVANQNSALSNQLQVAELLNKKTLSSDRTAVQVPGAPPIPFASLSTTPVPDRSGTSKLDSKAKRRNRKIMTATTQEAKNRKLFGPNRPKHGKQSTSKYSKKGKTPTPMKSKNRKLRG